MKKNIQQEIDHGSASYLWQTLFMRHHIPMNGVIVEVAPGYEPKIAQALAALRFEGILLLVEPDREAGTYIQKTYPLILPHAKIVLVSKPLHILEGGVDIPLHVDALVASHPFDDMVISSCIQKKSFFTEEKKAKSSHLVHDAYDALTDKDYERGVEHTITSWKRCIEIIDPRFLIVSQYPSRTLEEKGMVKRQESGFMVLDRLKKYYKDFLVNQSRIHVSSYKGDPRWWIFAKNPRISLKNVLTQKPDVFGRLGKSIFVPHTMRRLKKSEYEIVYVDETYFKKFRKYNKLRIAQEFAFVIHTKKSFHRHSRRAFADKQRDKTGISLSGNRGSGRAVYCGDRFNMLGVGKTTLCTSAIPTHSTGDLELVGAMRRVILSCWINHFTKRAPIHPVLLVLRKTVRRKWSALPVHTALVVRVDDGSLDRPSHIEEAPNVPVDFKQTLAEYAQLDAEFFAYRFMLGAWSTGNFSIHGHVIDLESASFVRCRGPYSTSSSKYPHTLFGYEGMGFLKILNQLADSKKIYKKNILRQFYKERQRHLGRCFLRLIGVEEGSLQDFFVRYEGHVVQVSNQFELLSKKICFHKADLNLYRSISPRKDPVLVDMSRLFRHLSSLYSSPRREEEAFKALVREDIFLYGDPTVEDAHLSEAQKFLKSHSLVSQNQIKGLLQEIKIYIKNLFRLINLLDKEQCLGAKKNWKQRLLTINIDMPSMYDLNKKLNHLAESYHHKKMSAERLGKEIKKLCSVSTRA